MHTEFSVEVNYQKVWRAKEDAFIQVNSTHEESFAYLPKYWEDLDAANPGNLVTLEHTEENKFQRIFLYLSA